VARLAVWFLEFVWSLTIGVSAFRWTPERGVVYDEGMRAPFLAPLACLCAVAARGAEAQAQPFPPWDGKETVAEYAKRAGLEPTKTLDLGNGVKLELVLIPAGKFLMGSTEAQKVGSPVEAQHEVTLTKPFYFGKFEVTQEQYQQVMARNPSQFKGRGLPVEMVSWDDAQEFCKKVSEKTGHSVRLPTGAEWEYACRAGTKTTHYTGDAETDLDRAAWYYRNSNRMTHPVGQKVPNAWGLYDMHGNVWEWCAEWYAGYGAEAATDPRGPERGSSRVRCGGSCRNTPKCCRSSSRDRSSPDDRECWNGLRVAAEAPSKTP